MKYFLPCLLIIGCSPTARQTHLQIADAVSASVNTVAPAVVEEYKIQLRTCRGEPDFPSYQLCASKVDEKWSHFRDLYSNIRRMQDDYAKALETKDPGVVEYVQWLQTAWCHLKTVAPFKMPEVPGVKCSDE